MRKMTLFVVLLLAIPVVAFSPRGRSMAASSGDEVYMWRTHETVEASRFFARTSTDALELLMTDEGLSGGELDEYNLDDNSSYLTLYQVDAQVDYGLLAPIKLPARVTFREARALSDQVIVLIYDVAGPLGTGPVANIYIVEHLVYVDFIGFTSGRYILPLDALGLPRNDVVRTAYVFSSNIPSEFIGYTVGAGADIINTKIDTRSGEYVRGDWTRTSLPQSSSDSDVQTPSIELNWNSESSAQRMRWQHGSLLLTIYYSPLDETGDPGVHLTKDDLIQIAEGMSVLHQTPEPGTILTSYRVAQWDTCWAIALQYDTTIATLVRLNNLSADCDLIYEGDSLLVPLPVARLPVAETDMDCDSRPERIEVIPSPTSESGNLTYGVVLEKLSDIGIYQEVWRYTVADAGVRNVTRPAVFSTGDCQPFMAFNVLGGGDFGLKLYRWDGNEMDLTWAAEGAAMNIGAMDGIVTEIATLNLFYDPVTETCTRTTIAYSWNGEAFVEISRNSVAGGNCDLAE